MKMLMTLPSSYMNVLWAGCGGGGGGTSAPHSCHWILSSFPGVSHCTVLISSYRYGHPKDRDAEWTTTLIARCHTHFRLALDKSGSEMETLSITVMIGIYECKSLYRGEMMWTVLKMWQVQLDSWWTMMGVMDQLWNRFDNYGWRCFIFFRFSTWYDVNKLFKSIKTKK